MRGRLGRSWRRMAAGGRATRAPRTVLVFFALVFVVYTCVFPYLAKANDPNENVRTYMTMALVEQHTFRIDAMVERHGWVNDMARVPDKKTKESHYYSVKAPAVSYAGVPFYWLMTKIAPRFGHKVPGPSAKAEDRAWWFRATTLVLRIFTVQLPCFFFLVWFERWLRKTTPDPVLRLSAVTAVGLGTNYLAYALMFASHAPFAAAAFASFAVITGERVRSRDVSGPNGLAVAASLLGGAGLAATALLWKRVPVSSLFWPAGTVGLGALSVLVALAALSPTGALRCRPGRAFLAGLLAGLATLLEYHALPVSLGLALYALTAFFRPTRAALFAVGAALSALALMFFQWRAFGDPFMPGHRLSENPAFAALLNQGYFGIGKPSLEVAKDISLSHAFGLFGTSPFMWLGFLAIPFALFGTFGARFERRHRRIATMTWILLMAVLWTTVSAAINWRGGWTVGPRYLGAAPPFFAWGAVCGLERFAGTSLLRRTLARALAGGTAIASTIQTGLISIMINTIPETVTRPLPQLAIPLARTAFVPHHALELFGWMAPWPWYGVAGCLLCAALLAALAPSDDGYASFFLRVPLVLFFAAVALRPAFSEPEEDEGTELNAIEYFVHDWEPPARDIIATRRVEAERAFPKRPCLWFKIADMDRRVHLLPEAARDEKRAGILRSACK